MKLTIFENFAARIDFLYKEFRFNLREYFQSWQQVQSVFAL